MRDKSGKILRTKKRIMKYIDITSEDLFDRLIKKGLPAIVIDGRWVSHTDNLDDFFRLLTRRGIRKVPVDAE